LWVEAAEHVLGRAGRDGSGRQSLQCASHFNHKEVGIILVFYFAVLDANPSGDSFGTRKGKSSAVLEGMLMTWNVSRLAHLRQCKFCIDLSFSSSEQGTVKIVSGEGSKMGGGRGPSLPACDKPILNSALGTMGSCIFGPCSPAIYKFSCFLLTFAAAVHRRPGMTAPPLLSDPSAPPPPERHRLASLRAEVLMHTSNTDTPHSAVKYAK